MWCFTYVGLAPVPIACLIEDLLTGIFGVSYELFRNSLEQTGYLDISQSLEAFEKCLMVR